MCNTKTVLRTSTLDEEGWKMKTLNLLDDRQKATSLRIVGYHEELWMPKVQLLFLSMFNWFFFVVGYVCLIFTIQWNSAIELG